MSDSSLASPTPPPPEACPPPLAWQEVLQGVEEQAEAFTFSCGGIELEGLSIGEGPPIWFLTGFAGDRQVYSLLAWLLRDRFRCILSNADWPENTPAGSLQALLAHCYESAFDAVGTPRPTVFGTAFGAQTVLKLLVTSPPGALRAAVIHEGFLRRTPSLTERALAWGASMSAKGLGDVPNWPQLQEANHRRWFPPIDPGRWQFLLDNLGTTPVRRWSKLARAAAATKIDAGRLRDVQTPVLLLRTEGDGPVATAGMNELMVHLPNVREETLHTSGHFAYLTHPHRVAKIVAAFVNSL